MLFTAIAFLFLTLAGLILALAGTVFNWVVIRTVFQFGTYFGTSEGMLTAWGVIRDIANIGLLFGFIFMGVMLILNVDGGGHGHGHGGMSAKKAIPRLIIFAVLLNFSLFASQAVVDVANAFSASFATLAGQSCSTNTSNGKATDADETNAECANVGIAGQILEAAGLTSLWNNEALDIKTAMQNLVDRPVSYAVSLIMLAIFVLITAVVLLAGAIMLIIRVVMLSLLMVTSPIGFAGMVIPKLDGIASMWWNKLISQAFFAPVYLLLIFISIKLTEGLSAGDATLANALIANGGSSVSGNMQVVMVYLVVIGFMVASLVVASKMGATGASFAIGFAQRNVTYPFSLIGRGTIGAGSSKALNSYESASGRARSRVKDIKNPVLRFAASSALNAADDAAVGTLTQGKNMKFFGGKSYEEESKHRAEQNSHNLHSADKAQQNADLKAAIAANDTTAVQAVLQKMGVQDIRDTLKEIKADGLNVIAENLSPEKFAELMKDKELSSDKKHELQHGRFHALEGATVADKDAIRRWSNDDLVEFAKADPSGFARLVGLEGADGGSMLSDDQREALEKAKGLTNSQRQLVKDNSAVKRIDAHVKSADPARLARAKVLVTTIKKGKDRAKLDAASLASPEIADTLVASDLKEIMSEAKLDDTQRRMIISRITNPAHPNYTSINAYLANPRTDALVKAYWT